MKNKKTYFCYSTNAFLIGGAESYGIRLFQEMQKKGISNILILWEGAYIDSKWSEELKRLQVETLYISEDNPLCRLKKVSGEKFSFDKGSRVIVVAVTPHNYLNALYFSRKYWRVEFRCIFYQLVQTVFDSSFRDENWIKFYVHTFIKKLTIPQNFFVAFADCGEYVCKKYAVNFKGRVLPIGMQIKKLDMDIVKKRVQSNDFTVLSVSRMSGDAKFYNLGLLDAFALLKERRKDMKLLLIGSGEHMAMYKLKAASYKEEINRDIIFIGDVEYSKLGAYIEQADVMVGMGTSVLEAAMNGLIAVLAGPYGIGTNAQGYFHETGSVGWKVREDDPVFPLSEAVEKVYLMEAEEYIQSSVQSYEMLKKRYDIRKNVQLFLKHVSKKKPNVLYVLLLGVLEWIGKKYMI